MPSLVLAAPTLASSKSVSLQCAPPVVSPPVLPEAPTPSTDRTRVLDNFAGAVFSSCKGGWTVSVPLSRRCKATQSPRTNTRASPSISQHAHWPLFSLGVALSCCRLARRTSSSCGVVIAGSSGLKPAYAVWVSTATGDGSLDEAASEDCAVVEASRLMRSSTHCLRRPPAAPRARSKARAQRR